MVDPKLLILPELSTKPLVSVLMVNYNYGDFIGEAIESVLKQTYQDFEIIVCDDGSTDNSRVVICNYAERDSRIKCIFKENGGVSSALNVAYSACTGSVIAFLDSDDIFLPGKLQEVVAAFLEKPACGSVTHQVSYVSRTGSALSLDWYPRIPDSGWLHRDLLKKGGRCSVGPASVLCLRKEVAERIFPIPQDLKRLVDGYIASCAEFMAMTRGLRRCLSKYRLHGSNVTGSLTPSLTSMTEFLEDERSLIRRKNEFLNATYGYNDLLKIEEIPGYWDQMLSLFVLGGERHVGPYTPASVMQLIHRVPSGRRRIAWMMLILLPSKQIRVSVLSLWYGLGRIKTVFKRLGLDLGYR